MEILLQRNMCNFPNLHWYLPFSTAFVQWFSTSPSVRAEFRTGAMTHRTAGSLRFRNTYWCNEFTTEYPPIEVSIAIMNRSTRSRANLATHE
jgi:hypothetical protein